jgi:very-short-patch-repair endonuclease
VAAALRKVALATIAPQTGWWFKIREKDPQFAGQENAQAKATSQRTPAEKALWRSLKKSGVGAKFRRQHGVGPYVLDFYCPEHKLAIEIEGSVHDDVMRRDYDAERHAYLESQGIRVLYFENRALLELLDYVVGVIRSAVLEPPPRPRQ